jgi:hypothetical protein
MLPPRLDAAGVRPVGALSPAPAAIPVSDARQAGLQRALSGLVGQPLKGEVLSKYDDGSYLVRVAGNSARMLLPGGAQVGAEVPMTLITVTPRPTFQVGNPAQGGQTTQLYTEAGLPPGANPDTAATPGRLPSQDTTTLSGRQPGTPAAPGQGTAAQPGAAAGGLPGEGQAGLPSNAAGTAGGAANAAGNPANAAANPAANPAAAAAANPGAAQAQAGLPGQAGAAATQANPQTAAQANAQAQAQTQGQVQSQVQSQTAPPAQPQSTAQSATQTAAQAAAQAAAGAAAQSGNAAPAGQVRPQSLAATLLGRAPLTPADQLPDLGRDAPAATLSAAARTIASALATAYNGPGVPATINGKTPLVSAGVPDAEQLAHNLKSALGESGLFYESHVAEWAEGKRPLQELMREPQNQRPHAPAAQGGPQTSETLARAALASPDLSAAQLINQQLHAHEQQRVQWNGQAWPGQPMQWEIQRDQRDGGQHSQQGQEEGRDNDAVWRSGVRFRLPLLGRISAAVTLVGEQVHIQVQTGDDDSAATLRAWSGQLQLAMEAAGSPLASLSIAPEGGSAAAVDGAAVAAVDAVPGDAHGQ